MTLVCSFLDNFVTIWTCKRNRFEKFLRVKWVRWLFSWMEFILSMKYIELLRVTESDFPRVRYTNLQIGLHSIQK